MVQRLDEIKRLLLQMKEDTLKEINKTLKSTSELPTGEPSGDIYDQASSERDRELGLLLGDREREKLRNIEEALLRFQEGEYGICEECGDEIPTGRLKVMPFARYCVRCKSDIEKMQAQTKRFEEDRVYNEIAFGEEDEA
jgi:DnaK suppressor protein